jgi:hypothetical protein
VTFIGVHLAGCLVLLAAGIAKAARPNELAVPLRARLDMPTNAARAAVRVAAVVEVLVGALGLVAPSAMTAAAVAVSYAAFTTYVVALRAGATPLASCGCFGTPDTPATRAHIAVTALFALAAFAEVVSSPSGGLRSVVADQPGGGVPLLLASATVAGFAIVVLTRHATVQAVRAQLAASPS